MVRSTLVGVALCAALTGSAAARHRDAAAVDALAESIASLMSVSRWDWSLGWTAFGSRARHIHWHLAEPGPMDDTGVFRRTGWISAGGSQIGLAVCGDEQQVLKLVARLGGSLPQNGAPGLVTALETAGVTVLAASGERDALTYRLGQDERDDAHLTLSEGCTPEGSAAARRCWTTVEVFFRPTYAPSSLAAPEPAERCTMPGRH